MTLKRQAKFLKVFSLRNISEMFLRRTKLWGNPSCLFLVVCSSLAWSSQILDSLCTLCCRNSLSATFLIGNYCIQWFQRTSGHRGVKPWSHVQLPGPHWRDCRADLPSPALPHLALRTPACFSRRDLPLYLKDSSLLPLLPLSWVLLTAWDRAVHLLSWKERTRRLPDKLLRLCRWNKTFTSAAI